MITEKLISILNFFLHQSVKKEGSAYDLEALYNRRMQVLFILLIASVALVYFPVVILKGFFIIPRDCIFLVILIGSFVSLYEIKFKNTVKAFWVYFILFFVLILPLRLLVF